MNLNIILFFKCCFFPPDLSTLDVIIGKLFRLQFFVKNFFSFYIYNLILFCSWFNIYSRQHIHIIFSLYWKEWCAWELNVHFIISYAFQIWKIIDTFDQVGTHGTIKRPRWYTSKKKLWFRVLLSLSQLNINLLAL